MSWFNREKNKNNIQESFANASEFELRQICTNNVERSLYELVGAFGDHGSISRMVSEREVWDVENGQVKFAGQLLEHIKVDGSQAVNLVMMHVMSTEFVKTLASAGVSEKDLRGRITPVWTEIAYAYLNDLAEELSAQG
jgi:hypothetical protein